MSSPGSNVEHAEDEGPQFPTGIADIIVKVLGDRLAPFEGTFLNALDPNATLEYPFGGLLPSVTGRKAIDELFTVVPRQVRVENVVLDAFYEAADATVLEYRSTPRIVATGQEFDQRYVMIVKTEAGKITLMREYFDPSAVVGFVSDEAEPDQADS
ncbi:nuclear transport factor 2 family protein [Actinomadura sp. 6K520]|uniref:nuclear transport factor 2 family protein n=1 Tax=Actinomadura sp. 6K520 TaxID=2530364 RepID=UPI0010489351|nr:nuclear transport factor 2 family protein [Actinomadura sp. 6K520]TDE37663.1 hypothetical protein E1289_03710 [Actinomadura sp. 6K520]